MYNYFHWSLRQLYLLAFWPSQFEREIETPGTSPPGFAKQCRYLLKMFPWIVALAALGNVVVGQVCQANQVPFEWSASWLGLAVGMAVGLTVGTAAGTGGSVAFGVAGGMVVGTALGVASSLVGYEVVGLVVALAFGLASGTAGGVRAGLMTGLALGLAVGLVGGVASGIMFDMTFGVKFAAAFWLTYFRLPTYPLYAAIACAAYFIGQWRPRTVSRAWQWCPIAWNEAIWIPLPFAGHLLALLVRQDRMTGFREIAFVAAERQLQLRAARTAMVDVAVEDLRGKTVTELAEVTEKLQWTRDAPVELPAEVIVALPRFHQAAQHIRQYRVLQSRYRQGEVLDRALEEIKALQSSLITTRGRAASLLVQVANEWQELLEAEWEAFHIREKVSQEIPNPFFFGNPVTDRDANVFTGRGEIAWQVAESVLGAKQVPTLLLHGARRMGKTSILYQLPRLLGPDFAPALIDCQNPAVTSSETTLLRYLSRALSTGLERRSVAVGPLSRESLDQEPYAVFDAWLNSVEQAMPDKMRALLCLDEYEHLQSIVDAGWGKDFLDSLRHILQHRPRVILMFTGAHTFEEQGPAWTDRFISARRVRVSFLKRDEVIPLLTEPIPEFNLTYAAGALEAVLDATNGQPFLTQAAAFELVQLLNEKRRREATPADVAGAIDRALVSSSEYFANVWYDAGEQGQAILLALVRGQTPPHFPAARAWLREHDVLNDAGMFAVPMLERWVKKAKAT